MQTPGNRTRDPVSKGLPSHLLDAYAPKYVRRLVADPVRVEVMTQRLNDNAAYMEKSFSAVAMVDISGYSSFTSSMSIYGKLASEVVTEEIGTFIEQIMKIVNNYDGDVTKFLGDAILIVFHPSRGEDEKQVVFRGVLCCLDIMTSCTSFRLKGTPAFWKKVLEARDQFEAPPEKVDPGGGGGGGGAGTRASMDKRITMESVFGVSELKLHTAVAAGVIQNVVVGNLEDRLDYFTYGNCYDALFWCLGEAKAGEMGITATAWQAMASSAKLPKLPLLHISSRGDVELKASDIEPLYSALQKAQFFRARSATQLSEEINDPDRTLTFKFVNSALARRLQVQEQRQKGMSLAKADEPGGTGQRAKTWSEFRRISVLFIKLTLPFDIDCIQDIEVSMTYGDVMICGVSTGEVLFTEIGDKSRKDASTLGLAVNVAARIASCLPDRTTGIFCEESTWGAVRDPQFKELGSFKFKGILEPVKVWEVPCSRLKRGATRKVAKREVIGYTRERHLVNSAIKEWLDEPTRRAVVIEGESGIGKTNFVDEVLSSNSIISRICLIQNLEMDRWSPNHALSLIFSFYVRRAPQTNPSVIRNKSEWASSRSTMGTALRDGPKHTALDVMSFLKYIGEPQEMSALVSRLLPRVESELKENSNGLNINKRTVATLLAKTIDRFATEMGMMLFLDDAQWIDPASFEVILAAFDECSYGFLFASTRPVDESLQKAITFFKRPSTLYIQLKGFSKEDLHSIVLAKVANTVVKAIDPPVIDALYEHGGRRPLFASLLTERIKSCEANWVVNGSTLCIPPDVLSSILEPGARAFVYMQFDRLDPVFQMFLRAASIFGHYFDLRDVIELVPQQAGMTLEEWSFFVSENDTANFLDRDRAEDFCTSFHFNHIFIQNSIYESISYAEREANHGLAATVYEARLDDGNRKFLLPVVSFHYSRSSDITKAIAYVEELGRTYFDSCHYAEAAEKLKQLINTLTAYGSGQATVPKIINVASRTEKLAHIYATLGYCEARLRNYAKAREFAFKSLEMVKDPFPSDEKVVSKEIVRGLLRHMVKFVKTKGGRRPTLGLKPAVIERLMTQEMAYACLIMCSSVDIQFPVKMRVLVLVKMLNVAVIRHSKDYGRWAASCLQAAYEWSWNLPSIARIYFRVALSLQPYPFEVYENMFYLAVMYVKEGKFDQGKEACRMRLEHANFHNYETGITACTFFNAQMAFFAGDIAGCSGLLAECLTKAASSDFVLLYAMFIASTVVATFSSEIQKAEEQLKKFEDFMGSLKYKAVDTPHVRAPKAMLRSFIMLMKCSGAGDLYEAIKKFDQYVTDVVTVNVISFIALSTLTYSSFWIWICLVYLSRLPDATEPSLKLLHGIVEKLFKFAEIVVKKKKVVVLQIPYRLIMAAFLYLRNRRTEAEKAVSGIRKVPQMAGWLEKDLKVMKPLPPLALSLLAPIAELRIAKLRESAALFREGGMTGFARIVDAGFASSPTVMASKGTYPSIPPELSPAPDGRPSFGLRNALKIAGQAVAVRSVAVAYSLFMVGAGAVLTFGWSELMNTMAGRTIGRLYFDPAATAVYWMLLVQLFPECAVKEYVPPCFSKDKKVQYTSVAISTACVGYVGAAGIQYANNFAFRLISDMLAGCLQILVFTALDDESDVLWRSGYANTKTGIEPASHIAESPCSESKNRGSAHRSRQVEDGKDNPAKNSPKTLLTALRKLEDYYFVRRNDHTIGSYLSTLIAFNSVYFVSRSHLLRDETADFDAWYLVFVAGAYILMSFVLEAGLVLVEAAMGVPVGNLPKMNVFNIICMICITPANFFTCYVGSHCIYGYVPSNKTFASCY
ncbi:hypothetical protein HDU96_003562 [Phlyctochytrium bullatum]|nr:hypothetical protein HDU96_003562 [Phlyctochytrium bullatum]